MALKLFSGVVIICLLGAMLYATKAIKARKAGKEEEKKENMTVALYFFAAYAVLNVVRILLERQLG